MIRPTRQSRLVVAVVVGVLSFSFSALNVTHLHIGAADFTWALGGAADLLHGRNPYTDPAFQPTHHYPYSDPIFYPVPALLAAVPFLAFPPFIAGPLFIALGSSLLAYALTRDGWDRMPLFLSAPFFIALTVCQWSPLICAAALLPWLSPFLIAKPNLAVGLSLAWPRVLGLIVAGAVMAAGIILAPSWFLGWVHNIAHNHHPIPLLVFPGVLLVLGIPFLRDARVRLVLGLAIIPQFFYFYDQLPLMLVARTRKEAALLALCSWASFGGWYLIEQSPSHIKTPDSAPPWIVTLIFLPALGIAVAPHIAALRRDGLRGAWVSLRRNPAAS